MMNKKEKLERLDSLVLDKMIALMETDDDESLDTLSALSTPMNYLRNNQVVSEKPKGTVEEGVKKRLAEAAKRRARMESI